MTAGPDAVSPAEGKLGALWARASDALARPFRRSPAAESRLTGSALRVTGLVLALVAAILVIVSWFWSREPDPFWVEASSRQTPLVVGYSSADTLIRVASTLLDKSGGYLRNDVMPPGVFLDNIPNWEYGVLVQVRDFAKVMRNDHSRSQSQSREDPDLALAEPLFNFRSDSWILPATESEYRDAIGYLTSYRDRLADEDEQDAQFYARADNLREWLELVEKRLGGLTQRLTASVGQTRVNMDLAGDPAAAQSTPRPDNIRVKTPWHEVDDVFFMARGAAWALIHFMRAAEFDFAEVLEEKNARVSLRQIIRELEASQAPLSSPIILNGHGFGFFANHSLVMVSYLARANAAVINLRELLADG